MDNNDHPIVQSYKKQIEENVRRSLKKKESEKFVIERWHALFLFAIGSAIMSLFQVWLSAVAAIAILLIVVDGFKKENIKIESGGTKVDAITNIGEDE